MVKWEKGGQSNNYVYAVYPLKRSVNSEIFQTLFLETNMNNYNREKMIDRVFFWIPGFGI